MFNYFRRRLGWKLFFSYLIVIGVSLLTLALSSRLITTQSYSRHMMLPGMMDHGVMMEPGMMTSGEDGIPMDALYINYLAAVRELLTFTGVILFSVALLASIWISQRWVRPVQAMTAASRRIAQGNYAERVQFSGDADSADELGQLAASFNQMAAELENTENMRRELIGDVTHELRTPLTTIKGSLEGLMDGVLPPEAETYHQLYQEAKRMQRLVDDLQDLSKVESGAYRLDLQTVSIGKVVENIAARLSAQFEEKGVSLAIEIEPGLPAVVGDEIRLEQVVTNLIGNALQYTPEGGRVRVSAAQKDGSILVAVEDDGIGLAPEQLKLIFTRFYRVDKSRSRASGGSGIGLTIAKHLVEAHRGKIWAESGGEGQGSRFCFMLPAGDQK